MSDRTTWESRYSDRSRPQVPASPFIVEWAEQIHGRVLDLACGSGRHTLLAARRGLVVDAVDVAFPALQALVTLAKAEHLSVNAIQADLTSFPLRPATYDTIISTRYLQRSLFGPMIDSLRPGGLVLFETFLIDQRDHGHPKNPDFLLQHGELEDAFRALTIEYSFEGLVPSETEACYLARLAARRPPR